MPRNARRQVEQVAEAINKAMPLTTGRVLAPSPELCAVPGTTGACFRAGAQPDKWPPSRPWPSFACCHVSALPLAGLCFSLSSGGACSGSADCWTTRPHRPQAHRCLVPALCGSLNASGPQLDPHGLAPGRPVVGLTLSYSCI
ncbi:hypothetical protein IQ07DRAFT_85919 [Pyrenochaeta sp. DS3sAY3a]|nr:hypothetical protein IQ07DRAFT_85919 [Pyrenochaeta sp. DS3sAY3a]